MPTYDITEAPEKPDELIDAALAGEEVLISVSGVAVVAIIPDEPALVAG